MSFLLQVRGFAQLRGGLLKFCTWLRTQNQYPRVPICTSVSLDRMSTLGIVRDNSAVATVLCTRVAQATAAVGLLDIWLLDYRKQESYWMAAARCVMRQQLLRIRLNFKS